MHTSTTQIQKLPDESKQLVRTWSPVGHVRGAVLIIHGIAEHSGRYERLGHVLSQHGFAVRSFDLLGFGGSGGMRAYIRSWSQYIEQVDTNLRALRAYGVPRFVFGHSMGGLIALTHALEGQERADGMVLSAPALAADIPAWKRFIAPISSRVAPWLPVPNDVAAAMLSRDPAVGEAYFGDPLVLKATRARLGYELLRAMAAVNQKLDRLRVPTLVLHGDKDTLVPTVCSEPLGKLPEVERRVLPGLVHEILNEPEGAQLCEDIAAWMEGKLGTKQRRAG